jgi:hypothetical protein
MKLGGLPLCMRGHFIRNCYIKLYKTRPRLLGIQDMQIYNLLTLRRTVWLTSIIFPVFFMFCINIQVETIIIKYFLGFYLFSTPFYLASLLYLFLTLSILQTYIHIPTHICHEKFGYVVSCYITLHYVRKM